MFKKQFVKLVPSSFFVWKISYKLEDVVFKLSVDILVIMYLILGHSVFQKLCLVL